MKPGSPLPLLGPAPLDAPVAWRDGRPVTRARFLAHAALLAEQLPEARAALLACASRYNFMTAFAAVLIHRQTALLPPGQSPGLLDALAAEWPAYCLTDRDVEASEPEGVKSTPEVPNVTADHVAAVLFTSGSTGRPHPQAKTWGELHGITQCALQRFGLEHAGHHIVATVPAQHSYGFESSVLYSMLGRSAAHSGHPLYPADVATALRAVAAPRILVTTPLHLDVCLRAEIDWPAIDCILSATAPLTHALAAHAERRFGAPLYEIYGCSEAGALASRRTAMETTWLPYPGVELVPTTDGYRVLAPYLNGSRPLADRLRLDADGRFSLLGRAGNQIKLAGKRTSLGELNHHLLAIEGVEEGSFVVPDGDGARLAVVVVAPKLNATEIRRRLAEVIDPVFLPRPLIRVRELHRTGTGKLQRSYLLELVARHSTPPARERA